MHQLPEQVPSRYLKELPPRRLTLVTQAILFFGDMASQIGWFLVAIGSVFFALGTAMIPLAPGFYYAALCIVVWTIGEMLMSPLAMAWVAERAPSAAKGRYLGIFTTAFAAGNVVGPYLGMRVYEDISPAWVWYGCALLSIVIIPTFRWRPGGGRTGSPRSDIES